MYFSKFEIENYPILGIWRIYDVIIQNGGHGSRFRIYQRRSVRFWWFWCLIICFRGRGSWILGQNRDWTIIYDVICQYGRHATHFCMYHGRSIRFWWFLCLIICIRAQESRIFQYFTIINDILVPIWPTHLPWLTFNDDSMVIKAHIMSNGIGISASALPREDLWKHQPT